MEYIEELWETLKEKNLDVLSTGFMVWLVSPVIIFGVWGVVLVLFNNESNEQIFANLLTGAIIPWWMSIILDFKMFIVKYLMSFLLALVLVHHKLIKIVSLGKVIASLKKNT